MIYLKLDLKNASNRLTKSCQVADRPCVGTGRVRGGVGVGFLEKAIHYSAKSTVRTPCTHS